MKLNILFFSMLLCFSCEPEASKETINQDQADSKNKTLLSEQDIETIDYIDYGLSRASQKATEDWVPYAELETLVASIKKGDLTYFNSDKEIIKTLFFELQSSVPDKVISQSIMARLTALKTKFYKLQSAVILTSTTKKERLDTVKEFLVSMSNLNLQINKKLEKDAQNIFKNNL